MGDRHNLARRIWERVHGPITAGCKIVYRDGNRFNLAVENLACFTHAEFQRWRLQDENYRAIAECQMYYGKLVLAIAEGANPERKKERYRKIIETRRRRYGPSMGNVGRKGPR